MDSSGWLAVVAAEPGAATFAKVFDLLENLLVPTIVLLEVHEVVWRGQGELVAESVFADMCTGRVVDRSPALAHAAAKLSQQHHLLLADRIIPATAHGYDTTTWTQDAHFAGLPRVQYFAKTATRP